MICNQPEKYPMTQITKVKIRPDYCLSDFHFENSVTKNIFYLLLECLNIRNLNDKTNNYVCYLYIY